MLLYDNLDDAKSKLLQTIIYHKGLAVYVKDVQGELDPVKGETYINYILKVQGLDKKGMIAVKLDDPDLNYMNFKLGYSNHQGSAIYWFRKPVKQYKQGLRGDQVQCRTSNPNFYGGVAFEFNHNIAAMLEGKYPSIEDVRDAVKLQAAGTVAFHPNFAVGYDDVHNDFILEYKANKIGHTPDFKNIQIIDKFAFVRESLMEAIG